ncbi:hypothetical protein NPIL_426271 [Nephila pilipes]|uniref:Sialin n=1 Tax=Nephila pilipes TaxID=299642 RepID=A0A8X6K8Q6_NEPPI|nr:hypothetical protein NPIL_426271 [Nephila pilipes]
MEGKEKKPRKCEVPGVRYLFAFNGLLGFCAIYSMRVNINVAIVAMVNSTAVYDSSQDNNTSEECLVSPLPDSFSNSTKDVAKDGIFLWSSEMQGVILGAFYYGYCLSQIPGGRLAEIFSGKWVFGISTLITAFLSLLTPSAAHYGVGYLIAIRALEGFAQGVTMPAINYMVGQWSPDSEKGLINTIIHSGINIGTLIAMPLVGVLCESDLFDGWPSAFYVPGFIGCSWFILWSLLVTNTPKTHPFITSKEQDYISSNQQMNLKSKVPPLPLRKIFSSIPFWTIVICKTCQDWSFYTIMTDLPTYFSTILHFPIEENGFFSSIPHVLQTIVGLIVAATADFIIRRRIASTSVVRKVCNSVSGYGCALGLVGVCFARCDVLMNKLLFIFSVMIGGFCYSGHMLSLLDMSPEFAGTLMGIANTMSSLTGFITPLVVGVLTNGNNTLHQWRIVFGITSTLLTFATTVFIFFSSSEKQDWAEENVNEVISNVPEKQATERTKYSPLN